MSLSMLPCPGSFAGRALTPRTFLFSIALLLVSCGSKPIPSVTELLKDAAGRYCEGRVSNADGSAAAELLVEVAADNGFEPDEIVASAPTDDTGAYRVRFLWSSHASYTLRVRQAAAILYSEDLGRVEKQDIVRDIRLP